MALKRSDGKPTLGDMIRAAQAVTLASVPEAPRGAAPAAGVDGASPMDADAGETRGTRCV